METKKTDKTQLYLFLLLFLLVCFSVIYFDYKGNKFYLEIAGMEQKIDCNVNLNNTYIMQGFATQKNSIISSDRNIQASHNEINYFYDDNNNYLTIKDVSVIRLTGASMQPTWFTDNKLIVTEYIGQDLHEGQFIVYNESWGNTTDSSTTVHRIKAIYSDYVMTESDYWADLDNVLYENIQQIGVGVLYIQDGKNILVKDNQFLFGVEQ